LLSPSTSKIPLINLPFRLHPIVTETSKSKVEYTINLRANFDAKLNANGIVLRIPTPLNTTGIKVDVALGKAKWDKGENVIVWKIPRLQGGQECTLTADATLTTTTHRQAWSRPPINIDFSGPSCPFPVLSFSSS
jgi:AP-2 complex subunit mu-1